MTVYYCSGVEGNRETSEETENEILMINMRVSVCVSVCVCGCVFTICMYSNDEVISHGLSLSQLVGVAVVHHVITTGQGERA